MNTVPEDLDRAIRALADGVPPAHLSLAETTARGRRLRRRRTITVCSVAAFAVLAGALGVPAMLRQADARPAPQPAASTTATASPSPTVSASPRSWTTAAQRLLINGSGATLQRGDGSTAGIEGPTTITEVLPGGKVQTLKTPKFNSGVDGFIPLPGGGAVLTGVRNLKPGEQRTDGPNVSGLEIRLVVQRPDGSIATNRNIRIQGEYVTLLAADAHRAVLWRGHGVYLRDLATGMEERLPGATALAGGNVNSDGATPRITGVSIAAQAIAVTQGGLCPSIKIGGWQRDEVRTLALPNSPSRCAVGEMRFSPNGDALAVAYSPERAKGETRLAVYDTKSGALVSDTSLYVSVEQLAMLESGSPELRGMAWLDDRTVRVAVTLLPVGATKIYRYQELLRLIDTQVR